MFNYQAPLQLIASNMRTVPRSVTVDKEAEKRVCQAWKQSVEVSRSGTRLLSVILICLDVSQRINRAFGNDKNAGEGLNTEPGMWMFVSAWGPLQAAISLLLKNLRKVNKKVLVLVIFSCQTRQSHQMQITQFTSWKWDLTKVSNLDWIANSCHRTGRICHPVVEKHNI